MQRHARRVVAQLNRYQYATHAAGTRTDRAQSDLQSKLHDSGRRMLGVAAKRKKLTNATVRRNAAGVQLLSPSLHEQVFGKQSLPPLDTEAIAIAKRHLERHGLAQKDSPTLPTTEFTLPRLQGKNIEEHFYNIGLAHSQPYLTLAKRLAGVTLPAQPDAWAQEPGWVRYESNGSYSPISHPPDDALVFDVETLYKVSDYAVLAVVASEQHWYSWCSPWLLDTTGLVSPEQLISLPGNAPRLIVGHNVGYDRARIDQEYDLRRSQTRFLDTMSLHVAVKGLTSHQRAPWMRHRKEKSASRAQAEVDESAEVDSNTGSDGSQTWLDVSSMNSLADVAKLHCNLDVDKTARERFGTEDKAEIVADLQELLSYCADDVLVTHKVFKVVLPAFLESCPNPVTFAGVLHMGSSFLPVNQSWTTFVERAEKMYNDMNAQVVADLYKLADEASLWMFREDESGEPAYNSDPWLKQLDWSPKRARFERPHLNISEGEDLAEPAHDESTSSDLVHPTSSLSSHASSSDLRLENVRPVDTNAASKGDAAHLDPAWYRVLQNGAGISADGWARIVPLLLRCTWRGHPMQYDKVDGWLIQARQDEATPVSEGHRLHTDVVSWAKPFSQPSRSIFNSVYRKRMESGEIAFSNDLGMKALRLCVSSKDRKKSPEYPHEYRRLEADVLALAKSIAIESGEEHQRDPWYSQLDWTRPARQSGTALGEEKTEAPHEEASDLPKPASNGLGAPRVFPTLSTADSTPSSEDKTVSPDAKVIDDMAATAAPLVKEAADLNRNDYFWPKWYWDLHKPGSTLTIRSNLAPLLLKLRWKGHPLFRSRQHGWVYRVPKEQDVDRQLAEEAGDAVDTQVQGGIYGGKGGTGPSTGEPLASVVEEVQDIIPPLAFDIASDAALAGDTDHSYYKLPHKDGAKANVGSPLSKTFIPAFEQGVLSSVFGTASNALEMNAQCSYWTSARERVRQQFVVWNQSANPRGYSADCAPATQGIILPQVVTMGTVTRRAVESTWLAASNAKKNRLGSELKAMIKAPPGYSIVGADVDSEELWICCVMGDAQFGIHGATAIGWMTLEGTKSAGTDLHSKTASILGITRDMAKVFNYSRIYGAGVKHAVQLLMQSNAALSKAEATEAAKKLYAATKGLKEHSVQNAFKRKFWYGGTESHVFNTLEAVAMADDPRTPALGCAITAALAKVYLPATSKANKGEDFMPSRINWVVQSSGVDYLHMLMVAMEYLTQRVSPSSS